MKIKVNRFKDTGNETFSEIYIDDQLICYGLEDEERSVKIAGETRIPDGIYNVTLRTEGGQHERYLNKFGAEFHRGMLHVRDVPNFKWILIHIGNTDNDTAGCLLVGMQHDNDSRIIRSTDAYKIFYEIVSKALVSAKSVTIEYISNYE